MVEVVGADINHLIGTVHFPEDGADVGEWVFDHEFYLILNLANYH